MCLSVTHVGSPRPLSRMERGIINYYLARERKFQGTKVPGSESSWNFRSRERKFHTMVLSLLGAKVLRSESSCYPAKLISLGLPSLIPGDVFTSSKCCSALLIDTCISPSKFAPRQSPIMAPTSAPRNRESIAYDCLHIVNEPRSAGQIPQNVLS